MVRNRTSIRPLSVIRTTSVRVTDNWVGRAALLACILGLFVGPGLSAREETSGQYRQEASGWLQLRQDQRSHRQRVEPLSPTDAATLEALEQRQRLGLRELQSQQRRGQQIESRRGRVPQAGRSPVGGRIPADKRNIDRQRLDMELQRETLVR